MAVSGLPPFLESWLSALASIVSAQDANVVALFFDVGMQVSKTTASLKQALSTYNLDSDTEEELVRVILDPGEQWSSLVRTACGYFAYLRALELDMGISQRFEILLKFLNTLAGAFDHPKGMVLNSLVLAGGKHLTRLSIIADNISDDGSHKYAEQAHSVVQKFFNSSLKDVRLPELGRRETSLCLINCLFKLSAEMGRIGTLTTTNTNLQNVLPKVDIVADTRFSTAQRCTYSYYIGMEQFQGAQFQKASESFQTAFDLCHPSFLKNRRKILVHLVTCNIILGRFPSYRVYALPEAQQLRDVFSPIVNAMKLGHFSAFEKAMLRSKKWLLHFGVYHDLDIRCEPLLWRNLIKNVFLSTGNTTKSGIETVTLKQIYEAAQAFRIDLRPRVTGMTSAGQLEFKEQFKESAVLSIVLSLIDNGWINGYVSTEKGILAGWSSKTKLITNLRDIRNQYVGMLWGGERGSGVTEKDSSEGAKPSNDNGGVVTTAPAANPTGNGAPKFPFGGAFAAVPGNGGGGGAAGGGYMADGDDMEMEL